MKKKNLKKFQESFCFREMISKLVLLIFFIIFFKLKVGPTCPFLPFSVRFSPETIYFVPVSIFFIIIEYFFIYLKFFEIFLKSRFQVSL